MKNNLTDQLVRHLADEAPRLAAMGQQMISSPADSGDNTERAARVYDEMVKAWFTQAEQLYPNRGRSGAGDLIFQRKNSLDGNYEQGNDGEAYLSQMRHCAQVLGRLYGPQPA